MSQYLVASFFDCTYLVLIHLIFCDFSRPKSTAFDSCVYTYFRYILKDAVSHQPKRSKTNITTTRTSTSWLVIARGHHFTRILFVCSLCVMISVIYDATRYKQCNSSHNEYDNQIYRNRPLYYVRASWVSHDTMSSTRALMVNQNDENITIFNGSFSQCEWAIWSR